MRPKYMELSERVAWMLSLQDPKDRLEEMDTLDWHFEIASGYPNQQTAKAANLLVAAALKETVTEIQKEMYSVLETATRCNDLSASLDWDSLRDSLLAALPHADGDTLWNILSSLAWSKRKDFIPVLDSYCTHPHLPLQVAALSSLGEIWYALSQRDPLAKELIVTPLYHELMMFPPKSPFSEEELRAKSAQYHEILMRLMTRYFEAHPEI